MLNSVIDALATHRLTKLVVDDEIARPIREKIFDKFGEPSESKLSFAITCPWCTSMWVGLGVVAAGTIAPKAWRPLAYALALSSVTGLIEENLT